MKKKDILLKILFLIPILFLGLLLIGKTGNAADSFTFTPKYLPTGQITTTGDIPTFLNSVYKWGISIVGILALLQLVIGGIQYMVSGAVDQKSAAKGRMTDALIGLILALSAVLILNMASSEIATFKDIELKKLAELTVTTTETPTEGSKCLTYDELQNYVNNDYDCITVSGGSCSSEQGYYNCLAPSSVPDCSFADPDSASCACDMATNPSSAACTLSYYTPTYTAGKYYRIGGSQCPSQYYGNDYLTGSIPVGCELVEYEPEGEV